MLAAQIQNLQPIFPPIPQITGAGFGGGPEGERYDPRFDAPFQVVVDVPPPVIIGRAPATISLLRAFAHGRDAQAASFSPAAKFAVDIPTIVVTVTGKVLSVRVIAGVADDDAD